MDGKKDQIKTRIAPTPSGYLHKGNLFSFILTWLIARKNKGTILLRIDDLDHERARRSYIENIFRTLDWLEIDYDSGPNSIDDFTSNYSQIKRLDLYHESLRKIKSNPDLVFSCSCSRKQIAEVSENGLYPGTCINKKLVEAPGLAVRVNTTGDTVVRFQDQIMGNREINVHDTMPYFVVQKKDGIPAYQVASITDDSYFGVNAVIRGSDLLYSTAAQLFLSETINQSTFPGSLFFHHPLVTENSQKMSKSQGAAPAFTGDNYNDRQRVKFFHEFCQWMGYSIGLDTLSELLTYFQMDHLKQLRRASDLLQ